MANIIFMDNFDSFAYNLVNDLRTMGHNVEIYRNDLSVEFFKEKLAATENPILFLSPGPCYPKDAGSLLGVIKESIGQYPMIGVCLGHQAIIETYGGKVVPANDYIHGEASYVHHDGLEMYEGLPNPMNVARYHSLIGIDLPVNLTVNGHISEMAMSIRDNDNYVMGFQFHPESILTTDGYRLLEQSIEWLEKYY